MARHPYLTARLQGFGTTIFAEMSALAVAHDAVNLGQGFPDFRPPEELVMAAKRALDAGHNQYAPGIGVPKLRGAIAGQQHRHWGLEWHPDREVTVTTGATEALAAALLALVDVGDEVVLFEPYYDAYLADVAMAGGVPRGVPLQPEAGRFTFDPDDLRAVVGPRTKAIVLNTPHNPLGTVLTRDELGVVAEVACEHDAVVVSDEVYEHLTFDGSEHVPIATLEGMRDRTITISSAGKTFSVTGWKVGWACAAPPLTQALRAAKQWLSFTSGTPFQHAVAEALAWDDSAYLDGFREGYAHRRALLCDGLERIGLRVARPQGTYFVAADISALGYDDDQAFCRALPERVGVAAVPTSVFHLDARQGRHWVRFAFCKTDEVLREGIARLEEMT